MHGWRGRIGLLVPSTNTVMETEFSTGAPEGVSVHASRMSSFGELTIENLSTINDELEQAVELLTPADVDVVVYGLGIMPGSVAEGATQDSEVRDRIADAGATGFSAAEAMREAFDALGVDTLAALTPYTPGMNEYLQDNDDGWGYPFVSIDGFDVVEGQKIALEVPESVYRQARAVDHPEADAVVIGGTNQRSFGAIPRLEADLGKPVVSANSAALWYALDELGVDYSGIEVGALFSA